MLKTCKFIFDHPLNRRRKILATLRFAALQFTMRAARASLVKNWIGELKVIMSPGETGINQNIYCGLHDYREMLFLRHLLREDDLFLDVGSNVGSYSLLASGIAGARAIAVEPVPSTFQRLKTHVFLNNLSHRITCQNLGIASKKQKLRFSTRMNCTNRVITDTEQVEASEEVECDTVDGILATQIPTLIKIDVEGFESQVLVGAKQTLIDPKLLALIVEVNGSGHAYGVSNLSLTDSLATEGFVPFLYDPFQRTLSECDPVAVRTMEGNAIFIRDKSKVCDRLRYSAPICVNGMDV